MGLMPVGEGPGPEWVVELLEVRVVMTSLVSRFCCQGKSPPQPPKAPPDHWLGSGLLILSLLSLVKVYAKAGLLARTFLLISNWVWTL